MRLADAQRADLVRPARDLARGRAGRFWSRKSVSATGRRRRLRQRRADVAAIRVRTVDQALRARLDRRRDLGSGARERAGVFVASSTRTALPLTSTASGWSSPGRATNSIVTSLPPSWPQAAELTTTAACAGPGR